MSILRAFICLAISALIIDITSAANYTVGTPPGSWDTSTNFDSWANARTFRVGDNLVFQYTSNHDVLEVTGANYNNCQTTNPIQTYTGGNTVIPLTTAGDRYFICGTPGHCAQGMKVEIKTLAANTPASSPPSSTPGVPANTPPSTTTLPPPPSSATKMNFMVASTIGLAFFSMVILTV